MGLPNIAVSYWSVLVVSVVGMVVGALWYSPLLFGTKWMKLMGFTKKDMEKAKKKGMGKLYFMSFVALVVMSFVIAHFVVFVGATTFAEGAMMGFWLWLGIVAPVMLNGVLWEGKSINLYLINMGHYLVALILIGGILAVWR